jgi:hypothetical protein
MLNRLALAGAVFAAEGFLMERTDSLELMSTLKLCGMRAAYDEVMTTASSAGTSRHALSANCSAPRSRSLNPWYDDVALLHLDADASAAEEPKVCGGSRIRTIRPARHDQGFKTGSCRLCLIPANGNTAEREPKPRGRRAPSAGPMVRESCSLQRRGSCEPKDRTIEPTTAGWDGTAAACCRPGSSTAKQERRSRTALLPPCLL